MQMILGFLLGVAASLLCLFFAMFLGSTLGPHHDRMFALFAGLGLGALGVIALKNARRSSFAAGAAIALGLAVLLDAVYGIRVLR